MADRLAEIKSIWRPMIESGRGTMHVDCIEARDVLSEVERLVALLATCKKILNDRIGQFKDPADDPTCVDLAAAIAAAQP